MSEPIDMVLHCPECGEQHIDMPSPADGWDNPPHRSHLCAKCGCIWRPADVPTNGVQVIATRGQKDTWPNANGHEVCEHGVKDGDWCEPCNKEYKRAADESNKT